MNAPLFLLSLVAITSGAAVFGFALQCRRERRRQAALARRKK